MRQTLLLAILVALMFAGRASAQCKDCDFNENTECFTCVDTTHNAGILCTITHNGSTCTLDGACTGYDGASRDPINRVELRKPRTRSPREWRLVAVEITHGNDRKRRS